MKQVESMKLLIKYNYQGGGGGERERRGPASYSSVSGNDSMLLPMNKKIS